MKPTTVTHVSVDGVMQGLGGPDEDRRGGFERGGSALPLFVDEAATFPAMSSSEPTLELVDSRATPIGVTIEVYRPTERPEYATATAD